MFESEEEKMQYETWVNVTKGRIALQKLDSRGQKRHEMIAPDKRFHITPKERRMNQEIAASEDLDVFINGTLQPVRLLEGVEDSPEMANNPNHLSETDLRSLFKSQRAFDKKVGEITNPVTLERLLELAGEEKTEAKVNQVEAIKARLQEVAPSLAEETNPQVGGGSGSTGMKASTPR